MGTIIIHLFFSIISFHIISSFVFILSKACNINFHYYQLLQSIEIDLLTPAYVLVSPNGSNIVIIIEHNKKITSFLIFLFLIIYLHFNGSIVCTNIYEKSTQKRKKNLEIKISLDPHCTIYS